MNPSEGGGMAKVKKEAQPGQVRMLRWWEVKLLVGASETSVWRWERAGVFPRRRRLHGNIVSWRSDEIDEWIESRAEVPLPGEENAS